MPKLNVCINQISQLTHDLLTKHLIWMFNSIYQFIKIRVISLRKWLILLITFLVLLNHAIPSVAATMENPGFETGTISGWSSSGTTVFVADDKYPRHDRFSGYTRSTAIGTYYVYQEFNVVAIGELADLSIWVMRTSTDDSAYAFIQWFDGDSKFIIDKYSSAATSTNAYDELVVSHDAPPGAATIRVGAAVTTTTTDGNVNYVDSAMINGAAVSEFNPLLLFALILPGIVITAYIIRNRKNKSI